MNCTNRCDVFVICYLGPLHLPGEVLSTEIQLIMYHDYAAVSEERIWKVPHQFQLVLLFICVVFELLTASPS